MRSMALLILLVVLGAGRADTASEEAIRKLDSFYGGLAASGGLNGVVLAAENGKVVYAKAFGDADVEARRANTVDTQFEVASIAKTFTATAVLQLAERGRIGLDQPLIRYFPALPYRTITVRQLLTHSSGLSDQDLAEGITAYQRMIAPRPMAQADLVSALAASKAELGLSPGARWWYANIGYELLARLVETTSGQRFDAYVRDHILRPAGMTRTYLKAAGIGPTDSPRLARNYDYPRRYLSQRVRLEGATGYYTTALLGSAGVISTAPDLLRFDQALRAGTLLKPKTLEEAYAPGRLASGQPVSVWLDIGGMGPAEDGLGWFVFKDRRHGRVVWHTGGMPGCATIFLRALDANQTVIVLDNMNSEGLYRAGLSGLRILQGEPPLETPRSLARVYARTLAEQGADAAFAKLVVLRDDAAHYVLRENELNNLAYAMLEDGRLPQALEAFKVNAALFPASDNVYNSYGDALEKAGRLAESAAMQRKALALNPSNRDATAALARLERAKAP